MLTHYFRRRALLRAALTACLLPTAAVAAAPTDDATSSKKTTTLSGIHVSATPTPDHAPAFPATQVRVTSARVRATVNAVDVEDSVKYLPSVFVRKRNYGDTQPVLATRTWGVNSSARSLVYIDDIPVSALIANNNTLGAPRWGMTTPEAIDHIDMLYGPYSAEYAGNAMGGVLRIVTRTPDQTEITFHQTEAVQDFSQYGTHAHDTTSQSSVTAGGRDGRLGWFLGATVANSFSQPLSYLTSSSVPAGTSGAYPGNNKLGQTANVLGAGGLLHTRTLNLNGKLSYDLSPTLQANYLVGYWSEHGQSRAQTYLKDAAGTATYGKTTGFANNTYGLDAHHLMQALSLRSDTHGDVDGELVLTHYAYLKDDQWSPAAVESGAELSPNGRLARLGGTSWSTLDLKSLWRPQGEGGGQEIAVGAHADRYTLDNPTDNLVDWRNPASVTSLYTAGNGKTETHALWAQDALQLGPQWLLTLGGRYEWWKASDGLNANGGTRVHQPVERADAFSPKATLQWQANPDWRLTASLARAVRFPTVSELYQLVSTGTTLSTPNPDLAPERVTSGELAIEQALPDGMLRLSLFQEHVDQALIAQTAFLESYAVPVTYTMNVGALRNRGIELVVERRDVLLHGLELSGSVTFVDSTVLSDDTFSSTTGSSANGKHAPYVPRWRATGVATYRPTPDWSFTLAGRYSGRQFSTLDNSDNTSHVFGAFDRFLVFDARVSRQLGERLSLALGVDNLTNQKYFLYHPFPQRTWIADLRYAL